MIIFVAIFYIENDVWQLSVMTFNRILSVIPLHASNSASQNQSIRQFFFYMLIVINEAKQLFMDDINLSFCITLQ